MTKVITDEKLINELIDRGVELVYPDKKSLKELLMSGKRIKLYCGFDPSAASLHIGNAIQINKLSQFQKLGHEVIFLIGDFTGMIGDPTDKAAARTKLTRDEVMENSKFYQKQASSFLDFEGDNAATVLYNSEWSDKMTFKDLIEITSNFTVQQMIQRDMFQKRLEEEKPIYLHEFLYPIAQGYDCVAMDVDLEVGGNDQMFNMMAGRDLMKAMKGKEKFVMTLKLLADETGKKMGKSEGNAVFLDQTPEDMYGTVMSWPDGVIGVAFELCTQVPMKKVDEVYEKLKDEKINPRDLKMELAFEITKVFKGEKPAQEAQDYFVKTIQKKEIPDDIELKKVNKGKWNIVDLLVEVNLTKSKGEARRLIDQGGIKVNEELINDTSYETEVGDKEVLIQRGKRQYINAIGI